MGKIFNTTGLCRPDKHYMVNIDNRLSEIKKMVDHGDYFTINRARQYGKTTTLRLLKGRLSAQYSVFSISFEGIGMNAYSSEISFCQSLCRLFYREVRYHAVAGIPSELVEEISGLRHMEIDMLELADVVSELCSKADRPVVLIIDEVDQASDHEVFLSFLGMLRSKYLIKEEQPTFQSVILAGVYNIKNLKLKIRSDCQHQYNSPWNIASDFSVDMSFQPSDIVGMLKEYEQDHRTGMDISRMSELIYDYTSGYPFLVSRICKIIDEHVSPVWTKEGVLEAVKELLTENNILFDDMVKKLDDFPQLKRTLYAVLFHGDKIPYNPDTQAISVGVMFGFLKNEQNVIVISNRIFETRLYNLFMSEELLDSKMYKAGALDKNQFVHDGQLDMERVLERFTETFTDIYAGEDISFLEENGRRFFLLYLKPIINGVGNFYIEARTRDMGRTDVIIDYLGRQYICELKIWRGNEYNKRGEEQLTAYLDSYHLATGYMISFNFNKNKKVGVQKIRIHGKTIIEAVV